MSDHPKPRTPDALYGTLLTDRERALREPRPGQQEAWAALIRATLRRGAWKQQDAVWRGRFDGTCGAILCGPPGGGKTALAIMAGLHCDAILHTTFQLVRCRELSASLRAPFDRREMDWLDWAAAAQPKLDAFGANPRVHTVCVVDDLAQEGSSREARELVDYLLERRLDETCCTIITTNLSPKGLADYVSPRLASRMHALAIIDMALADQRAARG